MEDKIINILQVGTDNWASTHTIPQNLKWYFLDKNDLPLFINSLDNVAKWFQLSEDEVLKFNAFILTDKNYPEELLNLSDLIEPYTIFYDASKMTSAKKIRAFLYQKCFQSVDFDNKEATLHLFSKSLFVGQYGMKFHIDHLSLPSDLQLKSYFKGYHYLNMNSFFGSSFRPIAFHKFNYPYDKDKFLELWWEIIHDSTIEVQIRIRLLTGPLYSNVVRDVILTGDDLKSPYTLDFSESGYLSVSLLAKGYGSIKIGPTHFRNGRGGLGQFILGGERHADKFGQEFMSYFEPGDFKPPLNVYFSGYRSAEGFEGYFMMKKMGAPFLLITDPRLEGGAFYLGSSEFEDKICKVIEDKLKLLDFTNKELILSGLSMGTFGAMYYGTKLIPHAIIAGKPLLNLGTMAKNLKLKRPDEFATSLDLLQLKAGDLSDDSLNVLNQYFWKSYDKADLSDTLLAIAYMIHDDYDIEAYQNLLDFETKNKPHIIGKGWIGRHNDNSNAITNWFLNQFDDVMKRDFKRIE